MCQRMSKVSDECKLGLSNRALAGRLRGCVAKAVLMRSGLNFHGMIVLGKRYL